MESEYQKQWRLLNRDRRKELNHKNYLEKPLDKGCFRGYNLKRSVFNPFGVALNALFNDPGVFPKDLRQL